MAGLYEMHTKESTDPGLGMLKFLPVLATKIKEVTRPLGGQLRLVHLSSRDLPFHPKR
jgi:hypothetical protein